MKIHAHRSSVRTPPILRESSRISNLEFEGRHGTPVPAHTFGATENSPSSQLNEKAT